MLHIEKQRPLKLRLHPLASTIRQVLSPSSSKSLAALALLAGLSAGPASAATITVNASCTLVDAITAANNNAATGGCPAGSGADTIVLPAKSTQTLTAANSYYVAAYNGLPVISSAITIAGNGSTIQRDPAAPPFRILSVNGNGNLTLNSTTVSGGYSSGFGGGIGNGGVLTLNNSTVSGNTVAVRAAGGSQGGGIDNIAGVVNLNNSTVSGNTVYGFGGGINNNTGTVILSNSTVTGNISHYHTGGIASIGTGHLIFSRSVISGNTAQYLFTREVGVDWRTTVSANDHNLFGYDSRVGTSFTPGATDIVPWQPLSAILGPLADNGGPTPTHLLVKGSPAINASPKDAQCAKTDQRGVTRPQGSGCDIGAVEVTFCDTATPTTGCTVNGVPNQRCEGTDAADTIIGTGGNDIIRGLGGNDILKGGGGNDKLCGGVGNDRLEGGIGLDQLFGSFGADRLLGGDGDDSLFGEQDNDNLDGGLGADKLNGGPGTKDTCLSDGSDTSKVGCEL